MRRRKFIILIGGAATALGQTIAPSLLIRADEVVE